jgi:putative hydrolase of the HAD superfamily
MLKAVLFDLDNTLVDRDRAFRECVLAHCHDPVAQAEIFRLDRGGRGERGALFELWERRTGAPVNQSLLGRWLAERLQPDRSLLEALRALSNKVKLGIITNGSGDVQRRKFMAAGLAEVIPPERLWVSGEVGKAKPDTAIFLMASQALGESPENCLYIGDREYEDRGGALKAGMRARRIDSVLTAERLASLLRDELTQ